MGLTIKNKNSFELSEDLSSIFSLAKEEQDIKDYEKLKEKIYKLNIDNEEKANILNKINLLSTKKTKAIQNKLIKEIDEFRMKYYI